MKTARKILASLLALALILCMLPATVVASSDPEHKDLAREAIGEGLVLLKNDNDVLPLEPTDTVALFGGGQVFTQSTSSGYQIGGGGSGWVNMDYKPLGPAQVLLEAAKDGKFNIYKPLTEAYLANVSYVPDAAMYDAAAENADTAIMFMTRYSKEGSDISKANWYLSDAEKTMLQTLTEKFEEVVVLVNAPSMISTDWSLDGNEYGIDVDSLLITYMAGEMGAYGMTDILVGDVNPSGKLVDTYAMDLYDYPSTETFTESSAYVRYTDDIYVGYRYFETFAPDKVAYEFGYGMSYTDFEITTDSVAVEDGIITVKAIVKNIGDTAGKEVVQVYYAPPMAGEGTAVLHKSVINLAAYAKTDILAPGESQTLTLSYPITNMASFDDTGISGHDSAYVLEAGEYDLLVGNSVKNNEVESTYTVAADVVVEQLSELCPTNLDIRMTATIDDATGDHVVVEEPISATSKAAIPVSGTEATVIDVKEIQSIPKGAKYEAINGRGYFKLGDEWLNIPNADSVLGNLHLCKEQSFYVKLNVAKADTYTLGYVNGNAGSQLKDAEDIFTLSYSADDGKTWNNVEGFGFDSPNTKKPFDDKVVPYRWWNVLYTDTDLQGNTYKATLPAGNIILRYTVSENAADGYSNTNLIKLVLVPTGATFTETDAYNACNAVKEVEKEEEIIVPENIDLDKDYVGEYVIQLEDVVNGEYEMSEFLAQMSLNELISFCTGRATGVRNGTGSIGTTNVIGEKYGIYSADTADGPAGIRLSTYYATYWPCSTLQACTWNTELIEAIGQTVGKEAIQSMVDIWLAPGMNIHRSPLCGRNFEYYSEDPLVTGKSAAALTLGVESTGVAVTLKHFCVNNKEGNRNSSDSRVSEKALREIYLKGFQIACDEADPECIMSSYNYLNGIETSENADLLKGIVRDEWGWDGLFMTDWGNNSLIANEVNAGNNVKMSTGDLTQLQAAVEAGTLTRETLEENAMYVLNALVNCPDFAINRHRVHVIAPVGTNIIPATEFSRRAYQTKFEKNGDKFHGGQIDTADADGIYGYFEYTVNTAEAGEYEFFATHTSIYDDADAIQIYVNGELSHTASIVNTGAWTTYGEMPLGTVTLPQGESVIRIQNTVNHGFNILDLYLTAVDQDNYIVVDNAAIDAGETIDIQVMNYHKDLSSVTAIISSEAQIADITSPYSFEYNEETGEVIIWTDEEEGFAADASILTLSYENMAGGYYDIAIEILDATGTDAEWTALNAANGYILVLAPGDITMDGEITNADVIALARYLVDLVEFNEKELELADYTGDGKITNSDLVKIVRYIVELA